MRKKVNFIFYFSLIISKAIFGQIVNPSFLSRDVSQCDILKIELTSYNTTVYFKYTSPSTYVDGGWVCAGGNFFIRDTYSKKEYKLLKVNNIPVCPTHHNFQYGGQILEFSLVFEVLPNTITKIDIIESEIERGFNFYGVNLSITPRFMPPTSGNNPATTKNNPCDKITYTTTSPKPSFENMLAGVKYAVIVGKPKIAGHLPAYDALYEYLTAMGFEVENMSENYSQPKHLCDEIWVDISFNYDLEKFYNIKLLFLSLCGGYKWELSSTKIARDDSNAKFNFYNVLRELHQYKKPAFNSYYRIELQKQQTCWTENSIKNYMQTNGWDNIEGIYESIGNANKLAKYRVAVRKINGIYYLIYLSGADNKENWTEGEIKATLEPTATPLFYKAKLVMLNKSENSNYFLTFDQGFFNLLSDDNEKQLYIKMFPSSTDNIPNSFSEGVGSGTGFAISSDGYIVTNYHVINGASSIKIKGVNGDFSKTFKAKVLIEDKNNDLSIIKIDDQSFTSLGTIPYVIANRASDVGSSVFVLGYPLRATMGDEVKLTNGIISSKSGFQGDVTSYQTTAPVQPGNSGGPLFDDKGNIIGIINAKHLVAENAAYAIKVSYLMNLIDLMPSPLKLQTISTVSGKPLTEQVKILKKFTYIIETNQWFKK